MVITDEGTSLETTALEQQFRAVFLNPADIGGRYSALSFFGMVPAALAGLDVARLLDDAVSMAASCGPDVECADAPAVVLGAVILGAVLLDKARRAGWLPAFLLKKNETMN